MSYYKINAGHAAVDNGARGPMQTLFNLASILNQNVITGNYYGDDYIKVPENAEEKKIAEDLMNETKLIWEIVPELPYYLG